MLILPVSPRIFLKTKNLVIAAENVEEGRKIPDKCNLSWNLRSSLTSS